MAQAHDNE
jgi:hypothetical protein